MEELRKKARELLESSSVNVVIGYEEGGAGKVRPIFARQPGETNSLIYDSRCLQNLAVYLAKPEVKKFGKPAIVAPVTTLKALLQLAAENQVTFESLVIIGITPGGKPRFFSGWSEIEAFVSPFPDVEPADQEKLEKIAKMSLTERWQFWQDELSRCVKCYACRAACSLCYCSRCTVDMNQPQWIPVASHDLGNLEWHVMRAMHLAGRCINCGDCARACPLDIPLNLLTQKLLQDVYSHFNQRAGIGVKLENPLSTFKPDDKESFFG